MSDFDLDEFIASSCRRVDAALEAFLPAPTDPPGVLHEAMRYAVFSGGKRLRPALAFGAARACGGDEVLALPAALAVELVHAYSLVHDDLPAMDDAAERRGRPSVHVKFGEANAVLTGDALLPAAFEALAGAPPEAVAPLARALARAAGSRELVGGQADDLALQPEGATLEQILAIHERKTGALFRFAAGAGARLGGGDDEARARLERFAHHYGLAFQATDDLLDADLGECSILLALPAEHAREHAESHGRAALRCLEPFGAAADALRALAGQVAGRLT